MTKRRLLLALAVGLILTLCIVFSASAADNPLKLTMEFSDTVFSEPKTITVSISVTNTGETEMPGAVTLYYPSGKQVEEFGAPVLEAGASKKWTGTWKVTSQQLTEGKIGFKIKYSEYNEEGKLVSKAKSFSRAITYEVPQPGISINRVILPTTATQGQEVTVTYEITNTGNVDVTDLTIKENNSVSNKAANVGTVAVGETVPYSFSVTMGKKDLTSNAAVTYKAAGKAYTEKVGDATVTYGQVKLTATLSADKKGGVPGDTVKLTLKLKNSGTVDYSNVTVTDSTLGTVYSDVKVPAGETVTLEQDLTVTENMSLQYIVVADNATGAPTETATGKVNITAVDPTKQIVLSVDAEADCDTVYQIPGFVRFTVTVTNQSTVDVENISVSEAGTTLYTFPLIASGSSKSFTRDVQISMAGQYQFVASAKDQLSQTVSFNSNILPIAYAQPTAVPTTVPIVTPPAPQLQPVPDKVELPGWMTLLENVSGQARWILSGITAVLLVLLVIGGCRRLAKKHESNKAVDHMERGNYRDYSAEPKGKRNEVEDRVYNKDDPEPDPEPEADAPVAPEATTVQDSELMTETLRRLYQEKPAEDAQPTEPEPQTDSAPAPEAPAAEGEADSESASEPDPQKTVEETDAASFSHRRRKK